MARLTVSITKEAIGQVLTLSGALSEGAGEALGGVAPRLEVRCCFDMTQVTQVNSCGIAEWIEFLDEHEGGRLLSFRACSPAVVNAMSLVARFTRHWPVLSVQVPYQCADCRREFLKTINCAEAVRDLDSLETTPCDKCGRAAQAGVILGDYLAFMEQGEQGQP